jgi:hypothetical protein
LWTRLSTKAGLPICIWWSPFLPRFITCTLHYVKWFVGKSKFFLEVSTVLTSC